MSELLKPKQIEFIQLLLAGKSQTEAAQLLEVGLATVQRWMTLPHVKKTYEDLKSDVSLQVRERINKLSDKALCALEDSLQCTSSLVKFQASTYVLERVAPAEKQTQEQSQDSERIDADLVPYMTNDERTVVIDILQRARERKAEAEEKITPIRKHA